MATTTTLFPLLLILLLAATAASSSAAPLPVLALLSLKSSLHDPRASLHEWAYYSSANVSASPWCSWPGVTCNAATGDVTALDLSNRSLSGSISPELRLLSPTLIRFNLSRNAFTGPLPRHLFDLRHLRTLDLSHNNFNSSLPNAVVGLRCLAFFDAYSNSFSGSLPPGLFKLRRLEHLNLGGSFFSGGVPTALASLTRLRFLHLAGNLLTGRLTPHLGSLPLLEHLEIGYNAYEGGVPAELGILSSLRYLDISSASLSGELPPELGNLSRLESLFLFKNQLSGEIPASFAGLKSLKALDLSDNRLSGRISAGIASLANLTLLSLMSNRLSGEIPHGIGDLPKLEVLLLWNNSLTGILPQNLGFNGRLGKLDVSSNSLTGPIPPGLCSGNQLVRLILFSNRFDSAIPPGLASCSSLWRIRVEGNRLSGPIPVGFGSLPNLTYVDLSSNNLSGGIPPDLVTGPRLEFLNVSSNPLRRPLPGAIWTGPHLQILSARYCGLSGEIPGFDGGCRNLYRIEMEGNELGGGIPANVGQCGRLVSLRLGRNRLTGAIPLELATLPAIADIDLSWNRLTGAIPPGFDNCSTLESLDVSFNCLAGPVPVTGAVLRNLQPSAFAGNAGLCGEPVGRPCEEENGSGGKEPRQRRKVTRGSAGAAIVWVAAGAVAAGLVVLVLGTRWTQQQEDVAVAGPGPWRLTAFQRLGFTAEDVAASVAGSEGIVGVGSAGAVYRAEMPDGEVIAVKRLWGPQKGGGRAAAAAAAEVELLGAVRHRNIVRLLGWCGNKEAALLLYEYMPNGSLDELLHHQHGGGKGAAVASDWGTRYRIAVGVAQGMCYLHHDCNPPIVHRDLKPSNILLDADMEAHVADFGVAKILHSTKQPMSVVAGSYGYIAPEYAYRVEVDEKSDVYSYGVVLMELVTGKRSVEPQYGEGNSIVEWVRGKAIGEGLSDVLDPAVAIKCNDVGEEMMLMLRLALLCTNKSPADRPSMRDVLSMLQVAKLNRKPTVAEQGQGGGGDDASVQKPMVHN